MTTAEFVQTTGLTPKKLTVAILLVALGFIAREHLVAALSFAVVNLWSIAPVVMLGLLVTAYLSATGSVNVLVTTFKGHEVSTIFAVSLIGAVLPVCGITVLPLVAGLLSAGVPLAPVMAFLLSSAVTDPQMLAITAATLGWPFAIGKTASALGLGLFGGAITYFLTSRGHFHSPTRQSRLLDSLTGQMSCEAVTGVKWMFWRDARRVVMFRQSAWALLKLVLLWLSAAFIAEYFLKLYLPDDALASYVGTQNRFAVPIAALIGTPLYLDGYAALPFVRGLIDRGMTQGPAMAFLIAGGVTSAWTAIPVFALFRLPVFVTYMCLAITGAAACGWLYGAIVVG